jgi:drug/metabolite transporter (DMT)-like permease
MSTDAPNQPTILDAPFAVDATTPPARDATAGPLDLFAIILTVILCLSWGLNQVAVKLALPDVPPVIQVTIRAAGATLLLSIWMWARGIKFEFRDGTLKPGLLIGFLFTVEYILIYQGLLYTSASRSVVYLYTAPIFVVIASRWFLPGEHFTRLQWVGIALSFSGIVIAFGEASPFAKPEQALGNAMMVLAAIGAAGTTLVAKASALSRASYEKTLFYQLAMAIPVSAACIFLLGESMSGMPSALSIASLIFQTAWVAFITFLIWYGLIQRYSANRLAALTFLTPLFGVAAGHLILDEPLNAQFLIAVCMVTIGTLLPRLPDGRAPRRSLADCIEGRQQSHAVQLEVARLAVGIDPQLVDRVVDPDREGLFHDRRIDHNTDVPIFLDKLVPSFLTPEKLGMGVVVQ